VACAGRRRRLGGVAGGALGLGVGGGVLGVAVVDLGREAEVRELEVAARVDEDVVGLRGRAGRGVARTAMAFRPQAVLGGGAGRAPSRPSLTLTSRWM